MKYKFLTIAALCFSLIFFSLYIVRTKSASTQELELRLIASKPFYIVGEVNKFDIKITNKSDNNVSFANALSAGAGYLKVFISKGNNNFKSYVGSRWGKDDASYGVLTLKPNESVKNTVTIFWNSKPEISNSSTPPDVIKRATEGKILTDYAFPEKGTYHVKASYYIHLINQKDPILIESEPIQITVEEPVGEDLEVWNRIKDKGDIAYFLQEGDFKIPSNKTKEREKLQQEIEQILIDHPNSFYAKPFKQSLEKFQAIEEKRKAFLEKIKQPQ